MRLTHTLVPGLLAGTMLLAGTSGTFAAKSVKAHKAKAHVHLVLAAGQVSNLTTTGFTLTWTPKKAGATAKTWQVAVAATTKEVAAKGTATGLANGEYAMVIGAKTTTGLNARNVRYSSTAFKARAIRIARARLALRVATAVRAHAVRGTVAASAVSTQLVITTKANKSRTFNLTATTKYRVNKVLQTTAPTLTSGEQVTVVFKYDRATKSFNALSVGVKTA